MPGLRGMPAVMTTTSLWAVSAYRVVPTICGVIAHDRTGLEQVQGLALGHGSSLGDVQEDDVAQFGRRTPVGGGRADVAGADDADFRASHGFFSVLSGPQCKGGQSRFRGHRVRRQGSLPYAAKIGTVPPKTDPELYRNFRWATIGCRIERPEKAMVGLGGRYERKRRHAAKTRRQP